MLKGSDFVKLAGYADVVDGLTDLAEEWETRGSWVVGTNVEYAIYVHEGTSRMEGRPYLTDAIDKVVSQKGDQLAAQAENADELVQNIALALEGETKFSIKEYGAVKSGHLMRSIEAQKL